MDIKKSLFGMVSGSCAEIKFRITDAIKIKGKSIFAFTFFKNKKIIGTRIQNCISTEIVQRGPLGVPMPQNLKISGVQN